MTVSISRDYSRLERFLNGLVPQDNSGEGVFSLTNKGLIDTGVQLLGDIFGKEILDVGVGSGYALDVMTQKGGVVTGITCDMGELQAGKNVLFMDMSFMDFEPCTFDIVWARHCVEHSVFPFFTLSEFYRVTKPGGMIYLEVPSPGLNGHESNKCHYSVMSDIMWRQLLKRVGYKGVSIDHIDICRKDGTLQDRYFRFMGIKERNI